MSDELHKHGRFFDVWSRFYRGGAFGGALRHVQQQVLTSLDLPPGARVLDLGCGPGDGAVWLARRGLVAVGLDYSAGMLKVAKRAGELRGRLLRGDAGRLPFADGAFDGVVCTNSFHHYPQHFPALREMRRVLKPGGVLGLVDPRKDNVFGRAAIDFFENVVFGLKEVRVFTLPQWRQLLADAGFSTWEVRAGPLWNPFAHAEVFVRAVA